MSTQYQMIVVDDEIDIAETLADYFEMQGFAVKIAGNGQELKKILPEFSPHIVLLDLNMPGEDGLTLTRYLREHTRAGIIMVTASAGQVDMVVGLEMGADDYVGKPFDLRALLARVRSVLRRTQNELPANAQPVQDARKKIGKCLLDVEARKLWEGDTEVPLTAMEFDLLMVFLANPNRPLSRDYLLEQGHKTDADPFDRSIDSRITRMRKKVEVDPEKPAIIKTVRSVGYVYVPNS
jgi:DNA-binding response OmpR family regulator